MVHAACNTQTKHTRQSVRECHHLWTGTGCGCCSGAGRGCGRGCGRSCRVVECAFQRCTVHMSAMYDDCSRTLCTNLLGPVLSHNALKSRLKELLKAATTPLPPPPYLRVRAKRLHHSGLHPIVQQTQRTTSLTRDVVSETEGLLELFSSSQKSCFSRQYVVMLSWRRHPEISIILYSWSDTDSEQLTVVYRLLVLILLSRQTRPKTSNGTWLLRSLWFARFFLASSAAVVAVAVVVVVAAVAAAAAVAVVVVARRQSTFEVNVQYVRNYWAMCWFKPQRTGPSTEEVSQKLPRPIMNESHLNHPSSGQSP